MDSKNIYLEIADAIKEGNKSTKKPSLAWVAGTFKKTHDFNRIENAVKTRSSELSDDTLETFKNILTLRDIAVKHGLMTKESKDNGFPKYTVTPTGSKFVQDLAKNINDWQTINDLSFKQLRSEIQSAKGEADQEWYDSLPPDEQHIIDIYSRLTLKEYALLKGIKSAKDSKKKYTNRLDTLDQKDPESFETLKSLGFINKMNHVNDVLVTKFFNTLAKFDYRHLRSFNRTISSRLDRFSADKALTQNFLDTQMDKTSPRSSDTGTRAREYIDSASPEILKNIVDMSNKERTKPINQEDMRLTGITDSTGTLTNFGKFVASILKRERSMDDYHERNPLNSRMPSSSGLDNNRQQRRSEILTGRKRSFKNFLAQ